MKAGHLEVARSYWSFLFDWRRISTEIHNHWCMKSTSYILYNPRTRCASAQLPSACVGLFTDLSLYPYGGTSADLSKIPPILR